MKCLFLALSGQIERECPGVKIIDLDKRQIDGYQGSPSVELPAVLLTLSIPATDEINKDEQIAKLNLQARVVVDGSFGESSSITSTQWRERSLEGLELVDQVTAALQGFSNDRCDSLSRISTTPEIRSDGLIVHNIRFSGSYYERF